MSENNKSELLEHNAARALENQRHALRPLATPGGGWEKDLRISTPVLPSTQCGLTPKAAATECFPQVDIPAMETEYKPSHNQGFVPTAKQTPHFAIENAETIEDNKHG